LEGSGHGLTEVITQNYPKANEKKQNDMSGQPVPKTCDLLIMNSAPNPLSTLGQSINRWRDYTPHNSS
jgi:hypothetical protein